MDTILIIGGVAAGMSAASRARRVSASARIVVLERGPAAAYGACGLPYFLSRRLASLDPLLARPPEFFRDRRGIELLANHEAIEIEPGRRRVRVRSGSAEAWLGYDQLILAAGAIPRASLQPPQRPSLRNVYCANTWSDALALDAALGDASLRRAAVIGAGYIGLEVAEALARRGLEVTLIDAHALPLRGFDPELAALLLPRIAAAGVRFQSGVRVEGLEGRPGGRVLGVGTSQGSIPADVVVNCGGLRPNVALAAAAGVALGRLGGIAVDDRQQTSLPGIYAAGDCAESRHLVTGAPAWIPLGGPANRQGRVAGQNAARGLPARFPGILGTLAVPLFGCELGRTGLSLDQARAAGFDATAEQVAAADQAAYLDPHPLTLKIVYQPSTGRLLGCHLFGAPGTVAGRLDTAATALAAGLALEQIESLDLAYAPALAPLYEPLLIAAHNARR